MSQTLACYKAILPSFCIVTDDEERLSQLTPVGTQSPLSIDGRRLVLPTKAWMKKGFGEDYLPFHPLCEVMSREGTSPVVQLLQRQAKAVIAYNLVTLAHGLMRIAIDKDSHKDLPLECTDFLKKLSNVDKTTGDLLTKLLAAATKKGRLLTVFLKNGGKFDGKKVNRSCIIRFPIMEDLQSDSKDVLGVAIPKKQRPSLIALFKLIVPFGDNAEEYSAGTVTRVAPYFTALLTAYHKIITVLNQSINTYGEKLNISVKPLELFDLDELDKFSGIFNELPAFKGNEGATKEQPEEASDTFKPSTTVAKTETVSSTSAPQVSRAVATNPEPESPTGSNRGVSMADFLAATNPQQPQYNGYNPNATQFPNQGQPNGFNQMTGFNQPYPQNNYNNGNPYAPTAVVAPWEQQQQQTWNNNNQPYNPFLQAAQGARGNSQYGSGLI